VTSASGQIVAAIRDWQAEQPAPLVVAIDGYGASGKTTIALEVGVALDAAIVQTDQYYDDASAADDPRPMARYYAWEALRRECLEPTIAHGAGVILVEGVSSASPALADLVAKTVFVATPEPIRLERLHSRISDEEWDEEWLAAEHVYFASRPPESFDLIVSGYTEDTPDTKITR
jgi:uridine kinase